MSDTTMDPKAIAQAVAIAGAYRQGVAPTGMDSMEGSS